MNQTEKETTDTINALDGGQDTATDSGRRSKTIAIALAAVVLLAGIAAFFLRDGNDLTATTIRILDYIGGVILENEGEEVTIREDMQLRNGNTLTTGEDGSVDLNLDDTKAAGLDVSSRAAFEQNGKALTINVESGALYFYTTKELEDDESMDIVTQTMMVGLRGTSGYVIYNPKNGVSKLTLTSGKVHVTGKNPKTGGVNETDIYAGQSVQTYLYNYLSGKESIQFVVKDVTPEDVPPLRKSSTMKPYLTVWRTKPAGGNRKCSRSRTMRASSTPPSQEQTLTQRLPPKSGKCRTVS